MRWTQRIKVGLDTFTKALFGEPAKPRASKVQINHYQADYTLTSAAYEDWVDEAYKGNETIHGALNLIINTVCEAPLRVWDEDLQEYVDDNDIAKLLNYINPYDTKQRFMKQLLLDLYLGGTAFIEKVYNRKGQLTELGLLRPDRVRIHTDKEDFISHYTYSVSGEETDLMPEEVIPIQFIDPSNRFKGFSPLHSLAKRIDSDNQSTSHQVATLQNGGQPGSILSSDEHLDRDQIEALGRSWNRKFSGTGQGKTAVLPMGLKYQPLGMTMKDLDFTSLKSVDEVKILSTFRIPAQVYGGLTGDKASTFNNMKEARRQFWEQCILPVMSLVLDALNNDADLTQDHTVEIKFDLSDIKALQEDRDLKGQRLGYLMSIDAITKNELRVELGYEPVDGGDDFKGALFDLSKVEDTKDTEEAKQELKEPLKDELEAIKKENEQLKKEWATRLQAASKVASKDSLDKLQQNTFKAFELKVATDRFELADRYVDPIHKMAAKHLSDHIRDATKLIGTKSFKANDQNALFNELDKLSDEWLIELETDALENLGQLTALAMKQASAQVGVSFEISRPEVQASIRANTFKFAKKVSTTSADQIKTLISAGFNNNQSVSTISKNIQALGKQWNKVRADTIARTETARAANYGAREAYVQSKVVTKLVYSAILDGKTSPICKHLNGQIVGVQESFYSDTSFTDPDGNTVNLSYNNGVVNPPDGHPNCRSTIIPLID